MQSAYVKYYYSQQQGGRVSIEDEFGNVLKLPKVYQRGRGLGGIFGSFWKYLQPLLMKGANFLKDELIETGTDVLRNISTQKPIKEILRDRSVQMVDKIRDNAVNKINTMTGSGKRRGNKRRLQQIRKRKCKPKKSINKTVKRKKSQLPALALRVKRPRNRSQNRKFTKSRILDIFT